MTAVLEQTLVKFRLTLNSIILCNLARVNISYRVDRSGNATEQKVVVSSVQLQH